MNRFDLVIVTHDQVHYQGPSTHVRIATGTGSRAFEARHEAYVGILRAGSRLEWTDQDGKKESLVVEGGMLSFRDNTCTIVV